MLVPNGPLASSQLRGLKLGALILEITGGASRSSRSLRNWISGERPRLEGLEVLLPQRLESSLASLQHTLGLELLGLKTGSLLRSTISGRSTLASGLGLPLGGTSGSGASSVSGPTLG
jgi:hypothetical protein